MRVSPGVELTSRSGKSYRKGEVVIVPPSFDPQRREYYYNTADSLKFSFFGRCADDLDDIAVEDEAEVEFLLQGSRVERNGVAELFTNVRGIRIRRTDVPGRREAQPVNSYEADHYQGTQQKGQYQGRRNDYQQ